MALKRRIPRRGRVELSVPVPAGSVEPFVGSPDAWVDADPSGPARRFRLSDGTGPAVLSGLTILGLRDRAAGWSRSDPLAVREAGGHVEGVDLTTGAVRWTAPILSEEGRVRISSVAFTPELAFLLLDARHGPRQLAALSRMDGRVMWRRPSGSGGNENEVLVAAGTRVITFADTSGLTWTAYDAITGEVSWRIPVDDVSQRRGVVARADEKYVVLSGGAPRSAIVAELRTGRVLKKLVLSGDMADVSISGDVIVFVVRAPQPNERESHNAVALEAISLRSFEAVWPTNQATRYIASLGPNQLLAKEGLVYFACPGLARIFDLGTGTLLWDYGLGEDSFMTYDDVALIGVSSEGGQRKVAYATTDAYYLFETSSSVLAEEDVRVHGLVTERGVALTGVEVYAHDVSTTTAADGTYELKTKTRGALLMSVVAGNRPYSKRVPLDGRGSYEVAMEALTECVERCEE
jgi:outer membrane protein assembly factor BamB